MIKINFINKTKNDAEDELKKTVQDCFFVFDLTDDLEIEIMLVGKAEIKKLNKKYRQIDKETDVLSFPQAQFKTNRNILGSIVICPEVVSKKDEKISDVLKHGFLHLLGYDHEIDEKNWNTVAKKINCGL